MASKQHLVTLGPFCSGYCLDVKRGAADKSIFTWQCVQVGVIERTLATVHAGFYSHSTSGGVVAFWSEKYQRKVQHVISSASSKQSIVTKTFF